MVSTVWFAGQLTAGAAAAVAGWRIARCRPAVWKTAATISAGLMLCWPLMRFFPAQSLKMVGSSVLIFIEVTGIIIPAAMLFTIAAPHMRRRSETRAVRLLLIVCGLYFIRAGGWMVHSPIHDLGCTKFDGRICLQSTDYTCVAASLVTLLRAHGFDATETEMARLSYTEVGGGTTDSRAVYALERKLAGQPIEVCYEVMDYERLKAVPKPCIVSTKWGYFISHMMPVLSADETRVVIADPLSGVRPETVAEFTGKWHRRGIYLRDRRTATNMATASAPDTD